MSKTGITGRKVQKNAATRKISPEAKRLILATVRRCGSQRQAARVLRLPNHGQLQAMLTGRIGETGAMKAAVVRAKARAHRAFLMEPITSTMDVEQVRKMVRQVKWEVEVLENFVK